MKKIISIVVLIKLAFGNAVVALAQGIQDSGGPLKTVAGKSGVTEGEVGNIVGGFINAVLSIVGIMFLVLMVYAGILWMTAQGKDEQVEKSRKIIIASLIGLFIIVSAYAITIFVTARF
ncbi:hypothetical protein HOF40_03410 [Candidatus Parcubacteria bacterium]|jgi:hypothetical protein|nr:hypothetical protein [Candidatus Parcubacteria bacterium]MBT3949110.1 hypothetical protein [Candidatus Parcubacteria bacterium]